MPPALSADVQSALVVFLSRPDAIPLGFIGVVVLLPGLLMFDTFGLDSHTFMLAAMAILVDTQVLGVGLIARRFATANWLLPISAQMSVVVAALTVERGRILAGTAVLLGLAGMIWSLAKWAAVDFGPLEQPAVMRILVLSLTAIASGIQVAFTSFLLGIPDIPLKRGTPVSYTGDHSAEQ